MKIMVCKIPPGSGGAELFLAIGLTVLMLRLRQNERYRAFGMVAAGISVMHAEKLFCCSSVIVHSLVRRFEQTGNSVDALSRVT